MAPLPVAADRRQRVRKAAAVAEAAGAGALEVVARQLLPPVCRGVPARGGVAGADGVPQAHGPAVDADTADADNSPNTVAAMLPALRRRCLHGKGQPYGMNIHLRGDLRSPGAESPRGRLWGRRRFCCCACGVMAHIRCVLQRQGLDLNRTGPITTTSSKASCSVGIARMYDLFPTTSDWHVHAFERLLRVGSCTQ